MKTHRCPAAIQRLALVFVVALLLPGCATGPDHHPTADVPEGQAVIYVYRKGRMLGAATASHIFVNGKYLTKLQNSAYAPAYVAPGPVRFSTLRRVSWLLPGMAALSSIEQKQNERLRITAEAGKTYYVEWSVGDRMNLVDGAKGARDIRGLNLSKLAEE